MAYTIKGLAKANECENLDEYGLAEVWSYWFVCNCGGRKKIIKDFKRLRKADRQQMLAFLCYEGYTEVFNYISLNII